MRYIDADLGRDKGFEWKHVNGRLLEEVTQVEPTEPFLLEPKHQAPWFYKALGVSLFLHAFVISLPTSNAIKLRLRTSNYAPELRAQLHVRSAATRSQPSDSRLPPTIRTELPHAAKQTLPARGVTKLTTASPIPEAPAETQSVPQDDRSPFVSEQNQPVTVRQLRVAELFPAAINVPLDLGDGSIDWHDATRMRKLPLAIGTPELILPGFEAFPSEIAPVQLCLRINLDGSVQGIQLLTPPNPMDEALVQTLSAIRFIPGEDRFGHPVPSLMILEFWIDSDS